jgi:hypothetical protein
MGTTNNSDGGEAKKTTGRRAVRILGRLSQGWALPAGALLAGTLILWFRHNAPPGTASKTFPFDLTFYYYPMMEHAAERIANGELPLWNPYPSGGVPFLATLQVAIFYPGNWLALLMPLDIALEIRVFCEVVLGGMFAFLYFRAIGPGACASALGGILFVFSCVLGQTRWPPEVSTIIWIPFLLLCAEKVITGAGWRWLAAFCMGTTLQLLGGFPQFLVYGFYLLGAYVPVRLVCLVRRKQQTVRQALGSIAGLGCAGLLAAGMAGIQLLPTMELSGSSERKAGLEEPDVEYMDRVSPWQAPTLTKVLTNAFDTRPKWISFDFSYASGYLGIATLFLVGMAIVGQRRNHLMWFFLIAAILSLILSFGYQSWSRGFYQLASRLPLGSTFRTPSRFRLVTFFCLTCLAVFGMDRMGHGFPELRQSRWWGLVAGIIVAALLGGAVWLCLSLGMTLAFLSAALLIASALLFRRPKVLAGLQAALLLLLLFDLAHATGPFGSIRDIPVKWAQCYHLRAAEVLSAEEFNRIAKAAGYNRIYLAGLRPEKVIPPMERAYLIADHEPLLPDRWVVASRAMQGHWWRNMYDVNPGRYPAFFDMASVTPLILPAGRAAGMNAEAWRKHVGPTAYRFDTLAPMRAPPDLKVEVRPNRDALPRAYLVRGFEVCDPEAALALVTNGGFDYRSTVLLEKEPGMVLPPDPGRYEPATIVSYASERVAIRTASADERILVLTDTYFPGWKASVDGAEAEILRANYLFRAVRVPAGPHEVVFEYRPASFTAGVRLSCGSLVVFAMSCAVCSRRWWAGWLHRKAVNE